VPRRVTSPIFVGRVTELAALSEALERASVGQPGIVLITGEAGVGKSRLLAELTTLAADRGVAAVRGACVDVAAGMLGYAPFIDIVRDLHRRGLAASLPASTRAELGRLAPEAAAGLPEPEAGQAGQGRLFAAVRDLLTVASASAPMLVTIEDLHWADASTLDLVTYLARSMQTEHYLLVATARIETLSRRHPLLERIAELGRLPWLERLELSRFEHGELLEQLTGILGHAPDPDSARDVFERSDGNAFFAEELVAAGVPDGSPLPASLRDVLASRLGALSEAAQDVVRVAAVAGRVVSHQLLEQVAGRPPAVLIAALREAVDQGVLLRVDEPVPGYAFRHALVREAASEELLAAERIALHRSIADALERDGAGSGAGELARTGEIAYHALAANDLSRAVTASLAAAGVAEQAAAFAEAEVHLERILAIWPRVADEASRVGVDHLELLTRAARVAAAAGHLARAVELASDALEELDPSDTEARAKKLLELFDYAWEAAELTVAPRAIREALPLVREEPSAIAARAWSAEALLLWSQGRYTTAREAVSRSVAIARDCGARLELARALGTLGQVYTHIGEMSHAEASFAEAAAIMEDVSDPDVRARATRWRAWARFMDGQFAESLALCQLGLDVARREGTDGRFLNLLDGALESLVELGRWSEVPAVAEQVVTRATTTFEVMYTHSSVGRMYTMQGRLPEAEHEIDLAAEIVAVGPHRVWQLEDPVFLAYASGRHEDGRRLTEALLSGSAEPERDAVLWWPLVKALGGEADRAEAARRRRRTAELEAAVAAGRRFAELLRHSATAALEADGDGPMTMAYLRTAAAEETRLEGHSDPGAWAKAVEARAKLDQPWELAYAHYRHGEAVLASGGPASEAALPLRQAYAVASGLGAEPLRMAIESLASRARIQLDRHAESGGAAEKRPASLLTARELEVLTLVAAGHTNREIGDRLFISERTASVHVTHAMYKLGALSRYEAAATATRLRLLEPETKT
jgi:DNA-binding CsgD family transcriptional regulator/tetratricopeptide (TPR) repeat protein